MHVSAIARTHSIANSTRKRTQMQTHANANARKRTQTIAAIDAWAISACKRDCVLRVGSKTLRMYYSIFKYVKSGINWAGYQTNPDALFGRSCSI